MPVEAIGRVFSESRQADNPLLVLVNPRRGLNSEANALTVAQSSRMSDISRGVADVSDVILDICGYLRHDTMRVALWASAANFELMMGLQSLAS
jgi:hypothetical protein